jgi:predicted amidohydrolase
MLGRAVEIAVSRPDVAPEQAAAAVKRRGVDLLVLPAPLQELAEASDGALAQRMGELSAAFELPLLFPYLEACSGQEHLSLQLVQADGRATANYRCTHLPPTAIGAGQTPGNWLTMARLGELVIGLLAGADHLAPEVPRALSGLGAELLIAVAGREELRARSMLGELACLRAIENGVPVLLVDHAGAPHAANAAGEPLDVADLGELLVASIAIDASQPGNTGAAPRRPELYRQLTLKARR